MHHASAGPNQSVCLNLNLSQSISQISYPNSVSRMQTIEPTPTPGLPRPSIVSVIRTTVAESGIRSLYTGLTASVTRQMTYSLVRLGSYEEIKRRIAKDRPPTTGELLIAASIAGALGGIAGNPAGEYDFFCLLWAMRLLYPRYFTN